MRNLFILLAALTSSCSSQNFSNRATDQVIEAITGKDYSRNSSNCPQIKSNCPSDKYQEWMQNNGQIACACN